LHVVIDEADLVAPEKRVNGRQRVLNAVDNLVRRGRARGIGVTLVSQRSAVLSKDVLSQVDTLVALRTVAPQDRAALDLWIQAHDVAAQREAFLGSLASLSTGEAWVWCPTADLFRRVRVRRRETWDSSATPKAGEPPAAPPLCPISDEVMDRWRERLQAAAAAEEPRGVVAAQAALLRPLVAAAMDGQTGILFKDAKEAIARQTGATMHAIDAVAAGLREEQRAGDTPSGYPASPGREDGAMEPAALPEQGSETGIER